ncbi:UNVERIFIED_CONTAM: hypothetical protein FKN15_019299 [Acipenser sinensis]
MMIVVKVTVIFQSSTKLLYTAGLFCGLLVVQFLLIVVYLSLPILVVSSAVKILEPLLIAVLYSI